MEKSKSRSRPEVGALQAAFSFDGNVTYLDVSKIGRMWISSRSKSNIVSEVGIEAYYDGKEVNVFNILEISGLLKGDHDLLLVHIVDYLNRHRKVTYKDKNRGDAVIIQAGYRPDYATGTPLASRNLHLPAPKPVRIWLSITLALFMFMIWFLPFLPSTGWLYEEMISYVPYPQLINTTAFLITPIGFYMAAKKARPCLCRMGGAAVLWTFYAVLAGALFVIANYYSGIHTGIHIPDLMAIFEIIALMAWIFYRGLSGCDCGAHKAEKLITEP